MSVNNVVLEAIGLTKRFPGVIALSSVNFTLLEGEIHGLMGENGAGKSTLIKILTGVYRKDSGEIYYNGKLIDFSSPLEAQLAGISTVYQEVNLVPNLSVAENLYLGRFLRKRGGIDWKEIYRKAEEILARLEVFINVKQNLGNYPVAIQQMVAIARALELEAKVLILDEPTSSLNVEEVEMLFRQMRRLKEQGRSIIFITHFIDQALEISDRITVLRNGKYIGTYNRRELKKVELISKLLGRELKELSTLGIIKIDREKDDVKRALLYTESLTKKGKIKPFSISVPKGQVVGLAGLLGSGRTEMANVLFGIEKADNGRLFIENKQVKIKNSSKALKLGIGLTPEDRKEQGIFPDLSVRNNIIMALQVRRGWLNPIRYREQKRLAETFIKQLSIKTPSMETLMESLSGGNQQKVLLARWLVSNPKILILDEPTRGIDVGAKTEIQRLVIELSKSGMGIIFISSELEEIVRCSSKVIVLHDREVIDTIYGDDINEQNIFNSIVKMHVEK